MTDKAIEAAARAVMMARPNGGCIVQDWGKEARDNLHVETAIKQAQAAISAYLTQREADGFVMVPVNDVRKCMAWMGNGPAECELHDKLEAMIAARPQVKPLKETNE